MNQTTLESYIEKYGKLEESKHPKKWWKDYAVFQDGWLFGVMWEKQQLEENVKKYSLMQEVKKSG